MSTHETGPDVSFDLAAPTVTFIYGTNGEVIGESGPMVSPLVEAFTMGVITAPEYLELWEKQEAANDELRAFMYGDKAPDFMPKIPSASRWRGLLGNILGVMRPPR